MIYGYTRVSTGKQDEANQRHEIEKVMAIDEFIAVECSSRKSYDERGLTELFDRLVAGDTVVVTEISRLARSISELITIINDLVARKVDEVASTIPPYSDDHGYRLS